MTDLAWFVGELAYAVVAHIFALSLLFKIVCYNQILHKKNPLCSSVYLNTEYWHIVWYMAKNDGPQNVLFSSLLSTNALPSLSSRSVNRKFSRRAFWWSGYRRKPQKSVAC